MFLRLNDLPLRGGERFERNYSLDVAPVFLGGTRYDVLIPEGVDVTVDRVAGGFLVNVSLSAKVYGPCFRCLDEAVLQVRAEEQEFAPTAKGGWPESELSAFIEDLTVDIAGIAREALVLALPAQVVCSPTCRGLCPQCGQDRNRGDCGCAPAEGDERWSKLKDLRVNADGEEDRNAP